MQAKLNKAHVCAYELLKESGNRSKLNSVIEYIISFVICLNVILIVFESASLHMKYHNAILFLRNSFFVFFLVEYLLRIWIADLVVGDEAHPVKARLKYMFTVRSLIDLFALLPVLLGGTIIDFRVFRVLRLFRITQSKSLQRYTDVLKKVLKLKGAQLLSSMMMVLIFMLVSAVIIYDLESKAQPQVFTSVLSGFWWSISTITTVGYGDIYPITPIGQLLGSLISIFGIFLMAVPIGILTSGFFEVSRSEE